MFHPAITTVALLFAANNPVEDEEAAALRYAMEMAEVHEIVVEQKAPPDAPPPASETKLSREEVSKVPGTFGDPVRVIENLPGLSRAPGGLGGALIIRGANPADSGVYLDGVEIPLLYHFGGLTSVINSEFLEDLKFMPGGFGADYGRATGGVVEVKSRWLDCDRARGSAAVDPIDAELYTCVPLGKQWKLAAAARRSYIDTLMPLLMGGAEPGQSTTTVAPSYFDYQLKAQRHDAQNAFEIFAFGAQDALKITQSSSAEDADQAVQGALGFHRLQLRHTRFFGDKATLVSAVTPGYLVSDFNQSSAELQTREKSLAELFTVQWRETLTYRAAPWLTVRAGLDHALRYWRADFVTPLPTLARGFPTPAFDGTRSNVWKAHDMDLNQAYWVETAINATENLLFVPGLRVGNLAFDETKHFVVEPRLSTRWKMAPGTTLKAASGIYRKLPDLFSGVMVDGFGQPNLDAERATHFTGGVEQVWSQLEVGVEGFAVLRDHLPSPTSEVNYRNGNAEPVLFKSDGTGRSFGAEVLIRRRAAEGRRFSGWLAYTLSRSLRTDRTADGENTEQFEGANPGSVRMTDIAGVGHEYVSPFDQTHILTAVGSWQLPWKLNAGFRAQYVSGNPISPLERGRSVYDADSDSFGVVPGTVRRNSDRMPAFHRLDLRIDRRWDFSAWSLTAYLDVMNVYNRRPVEGFTYDYRYKTRSELRGLPILPVLGVKGEF